MSFASWPEYQIFKRLSHSLPSKSILIVSHHLLSVRTIKINLFWDVRQSAGYFDIIFSYYVSFWVSLFYDGSCFVYCLLFHSMLLLLKKQSTNQLTKILRMQTCSYA